MPCVQHIETQSRTVPHLVIVLVASFHTVVTHAAGVELLPKLGAVADVLNRKAKVGESLHFALVLQRVIVVQALHSQVFVIGTTQ